jgi:hypothetical protein
MACKITLGASGKGTYPDRESPPVVNNEIRVSETLLTIFYM